MAAPAYALEHFYHGQVISGGRLQGDPRLLAQSAGVTAAHVSEALRVARLTAPPAAIPGTWALLRGESVPFFLVQAILGNGGQPQRHVVLMPVDVLRAIGGHVRGLAPLLLSQIPVFSTTGHTLPLLTLPQSPQPSAESQENAMLALLTATRDRMDTVETLLASIVQSVPLCITGSPPEIARRLGFIEGLLALLPPPARFNVTFATYVVSAAPLEAQIRFMADDDAPPPHAVHFDWKTAKIGGKPVEDGYARFIKSQLRLGADRVMEQTRSLTPVAGWRLKRGESLAEALGYASHRLKLDTSIINNQPVEAKEVVRVLVEDPTLNDETRMAYIRHLMAFALALEDVEDADLVPMAARGNPDLERAIINQLDGALASGKGAQVYRRLQRWVSIPSGFKGMYWGELLHRAAIANAASLAKAGNAPALAAFLRELHAKATGADAPTGTEGDRTDLAVVVPSAVEFALPLTANDPDLAGLCFGMAAASFPPDRWQRVLTLKPLLMQLPVGIKRIFAHLVNEVKAPAPPGILLQGITEFTSIYGIEWREPLVIRLCEMAVTARRFDLLGADVVNALAATASSAWGRQFSTVLLWIVRSVSNDDLLPQVEAGGRPALLRILLARGSHLDLVGELNRHNRLFYPADKLNQFAALVRAVFTETPLPPADLTAALMAMTSRAMRPLPLAMAYFGALEQHQWPPSMDREVADLTALIADNRLIAEALQPDSLIQLLSYHVERRDEAQTGRIAALLPAAAARWGESGLSIMIQMHGLLTYDERMALIARAALRRYIRRLPDGAAQPVIQRLGRELGENVRVMLEATVLLWRMMAGENLGDYAYTLHTTAQFLYDTALPYMEKNRPAVSSLINDLDSLSGGLSNDDRLALAAEIVDTGRLVAQMAAAHRQAHPKETDEQIVNLLMGRGAAYSLVDVLRALGGYFARGRRVSVRGDRAIAEHPLGDRAAHSVLREVQQINRLLRAALAAIPAPGAVEKDRRFVLSAAALHQEIESLWNEIALTEQRALVRNLAIDLQRIAETVLLMTDRVDTRVLQDDSGLAKKLETNRQRPDNTLELYRFIAGYFRSRA